MVIAFFVSFSSSSTATTTARNEKTSTSTLLWLLSPHNFLFVFSGRGRALVFPLLLNKTLLLRLLSERAATTEPCRLSTSTRWSEVREKEKECRRLFFRRQTLQDGFFVYRRSHLAPLAPLCRSPPVLTHFTEKLQAFLVNYLDPETDQLKYLIQLVRGEGETPNRRPRFFRWPSKSACRSQQANTTFPSSKLLVQQQDIANRDRRTLEIDLDDISAVSRMRERVESVGEIQEGDELFRAQDRARMAAKTAPSNSSDVDIDALSFSTHSRPIVPIHSNKKQYYPDGELADAANANARRYARLAAEAADAAMPPPTRSDLPDDVFDVLQRQVGFFGFALFCFAILLIAREDVERARAACGRSEEKQPSGRRRERQNKIILR